MIDPMIDSGILPLLEDLWRHGVVTYQSCSGHVGAESYPSAQLWVDSETLNDEECAKLADAEGIEQVSRLWGRERFPVVEIVFAGETKGPLFGRACSAIRGACRSSVRRCRVCGCTDDDCRQCIERTGEPCHWVEADLCSACAVEMRR